MPSSPPRQPPNQASQALFRQEALDAQRTKAVGGIVLTPKISWALWTLGSMVLAALVLAFLYWGQYTRRATVSGQIAPVAGIIRVTTPQLGVVLEKKVAEGQTVAKGQPLFVLTSDRVGSAPGAVELQTEIAAKIELRRRSQESEIARNQSAENLERSQLQRRIATLKEEMQAIERLIDQQRQRVTVAEDTKKRYQGLADKDYIPREQLTQKELDLSEQQTRLQSLQRDVIANQREQAATQRDIDSARSRYAGQNAVLERGIATSAQELTEVESRRRVLVTAPETGVATLITAEVGQVAEPGRAMVNILPATAAGHGLQARLYAPSRHMGFVRVGGKVVMRMQAFPYQKFGFVEGKISAISTTPASNIELAGFALPELSPGEPVYSITVDLNQQSMLAFGEKRPLQVGMRLEADIMQETRKLWEWVLEPLYSIKGRLAS